MNKPCIDKVHSIKRATVWCKLLSQSIGYIIVIDTVVKTMDKINYFVGNHNDTSGGTGLLYIDSKGVAGIYTISVIPVQQRKAYA